MAGLVNLDLGSILNGLGNIGRLFKDIRAAITGKEILDPTKLAELEAKAQEIEFALTQTQTEINKIEASHPSLFVAGWRPAVGWCCVVALFYNYILSPLLIQVCSLFGKNIGIPVLDVGDLMVLLLGMLGLSGLRTFEKTKGVENNH